MGLNTRSFSPFYKISVEIKIHLLL